MKYILILIVSICHVLTAGSIRIPVVKKSTDKYKSVQIFTKDMVTDALDDFKCGEPQKRIVYFDMPGNVPKPVVLHICDKCSGFCPSGQTCVAREFVNVTFSIGGTCSIVAQNHTSCECGLIEDFGLQPCQYEISTNCSTTNETS